MSDTEVTNNVFTGEGETKPEPVEPEANQTSGQIFTDTVGEFVGEGKKFKSIEALAASYAASQEFIETLKAEKHEIQSKLEKGETTKQVFEELTNTKGKETVETKTESLSPEDIRRLVAESLQETKAQETTTSNIAKVNNDLIGHFGSLEKATGYINSKATELGVSTDFLQDTAARSPKAFMNLVGFDATAKQSNNPIVTGSVNTGSDFSTGVKEGSKEYYDNMRKTNKKLYYSAKTQSAIIQAVKDGIYKI